ncbi:ATP-dependent helicase [Pseudovibrio sp. Tun.PSC04-5.I4]|uniref:ATP-binding domain-containing protein n=1 Tax=Pseudovibrio sp. Tun.PSC04-5.I4 TaxID=1798213 RepID=UPI00088C8F76|nr:ATP-dependent helicase [Pseudovibrio sp. Tun.PSC04-5.I4]SDQ73323.1 UvrD-like helicase C-terminal domain-containing protein [Pseudovibrio sp. Tun.PSC04-5.I4]
MTFDFFEGPAGSGKTFSMVAHARQLIENDALGEGQRMLALTFMNGARRRLTESLNDEASFRRKFDCLTFDSFAQTLATRRSAKVTDEMRQHAEKLGQFHGPCFLAGELLKDAEVRRWVARTYPLVLVDEAQDLDVHRQGIILGLKECCATVVAADSFQCLRDGQEIANFIDQLLNAGTSHSLTQSHRTDKSGLLASALAVRRSEGIRDVLKEETIGKTDRVHWVGEGIELLEVPAKAKNSGLLAWNLAFQLRRGSDDVAILTPDSKNTIIRRAISTVTEKQGQWPHNAFPVSWEGGDNSIADKLMEAIGFPASASYDEVCALLKIHLAQPMIKSVDRRIRRLHRVTGQSEFEKPQLESFISGAVRTNTRLGFKKNAKIKAMSIHGAKNREFDRVIVLWPHSVTGSDEHKRRLLYNAMTRAKSHCTIIVLGQERLDSAPFAPS